MTDKQVDVSHYNFQSYMSKGRWASVWHQINEVQALSLSRVLEIGPGIGVFKAISGLYGIQTETLDFDPDLKPDYVGSATAIPIADSSFDVVCAFQMLEHLPYVESLRAFSEMIRVTAAYVVISLPDAKPVWRYVGHIPKIGSYDVLVSRPFARSMEHVFDGEHYWEVNKKNYSLKTVVGDLTKYAELVRTYRVKENPYHRFFVFRKR